MVKTTFNGPSRSSASETPEAIDLLIPIDKKWFELKASVSSIKVKSKHNTNEFKLRKEAETLLEAERKKYINYKQTNDRSDYNWISSVITTGTFTDRLSANTLLIQDSPIHNTHSIQRLIEIVDSKGIRECLMSMENLKDLFVGDLLLKDGKLKPFAELIEYLDPKEGKKRNQQLILFHFEDKLMTMYRNFLEILEKVSLEGSDAVKSKAINVMFELLAERSEQEQFLLEKLVNKLGDPIPKRASHVANLLGKLVNKKHPRMKEVVVKEVERLLFRLHINEKTQYYALCFMNQVILTQSDKELANRLITVYFNFFDSLTKKGEVKNKLMNVLITGVSRAFPYANLDPEFLEERLESFYKLIHLVDQNTAVQGMILIFNVLNMKDTGLITDRFYTLLYRSLLETNLDTCTRRALYLNLLFKAMKKDSVPRRIQAFIKRLLQVSLHQSPAVACAILVLVSEIVRMKPGIKETGPIQVFQTSDDEEEEHYDDIKGEDSSDDKEDEDDESKKSTASQEKVKVVSSWVHSKNLGKDKDNASGSEYDPSARNPLYSKADICDYWELSLLKDHSHPSASLFAGKVIEGEPISYDGDPLVDFTLKHFIDRFVFRNPKQISKEKAAQSSKSTVFARMSQIERVPVQELYQKPKASVPLEEQFIYDYLVNRRKESQPKEDDNESVASEDFERLLQKFEPDYDADFMQDEPRDRKREKKGKKGKNKKKKSDEDSASDESDSDEMFSDEDDFDIDSEDEEYKEAFDGIDEEIRLAKLEGDDTFLSDDEDDQGQDFSKFNRRGRDQNLAKLFATADKFSHILEGREEDSGGEESDEESNEKSKGGRKRGKGKMTKRFKRRR